MGNPYTGQNIFSFFGVLLQRFYALCTGNLSWEQLVSDEIQLIVLSCLAISGALVGTFLVLRRMTMLANALSHTILLGIVCVYLALGSMTLFPLLIASLVTAVITTFLTEFLTRVVKLQEDASVGLVFTVLFALGIVLISLLTKNLHVGTELVIGNVDALQRHDIFVVCPIAVLNLALFFLFLPGFKITTFDPQLARTLGFSPLFFNYLLMVQTALTAVGGFRAVGVLMILAFLVVPSVAARRMTHTLSKLLFIAVGIGVGASFLGVAISRHILSYYGLGLSTAGLVVTLLGLTLLVTSLLSLRVDKPSREGYDFLS